jgi:DNA-binding NtrC family response regulator
MRMANGDGKVKSHAPAPRRRKILLVDNDPVDLLFYKFILEHQGYRVKASDSFTEAPHLLEKESFDMVVVGQGGSAFEGRAVVEKAMQIDPHTPVAVMASHPEPGCYVEAMNLGVVDYREKTADGYEFLAVVEAHLGRNGQRGE